MKNFSHDDTLQEAKSRRYVWVIADQHIGQQADCKDGSEWLMQAIEDIKTYIVPDYVINLGDISAHSSEEELNKYVDIRARSGIKSWYEIVGNHDFKSVISGLYTRTVSCPKYWTLRDGNLLFLSLPCERSNAAGLFVPEVAEWLGTSIKKAADTNIIICAHSFPYDTVEFSCRPARCIYPVESLKKFIEQNKIDVWLGGHIHFHPRTVTYAVKKFGVTFINAGSITHAYGTGGSYSFLIEFVNGSKQITAKCRNHDKHEFMKEFEVVMEFHYPVSLGQQPFFEAVELKVSSHYATINQEVVTDV
jgi:predicted phosphodiesterase